MLWNAVCKPLQSVAALGMIQQSEGCTISLDLADLVPQGVSMVWTH